MLEKLQEAGHEMLNCVRTLIVSGSFNIESSEEYPPAFVPPLLVSLVEKLSGLRVLRWSNSTVAQAIPISNEILDGVADFHFPTECNRI